MTKELPITSTSNLGMTVADLFLLPETVQPLARLFLHQQEPQSLEAIAAQLNQSVSATQTQLETMMQRGLVEKVTINNGTFYQKMVGQKRGGQIAEQLFQSLAPGSPLAVIRNPSSEQRVVAGEEFFLSVTIKNQGQWSALVDVFLEEGAEPYEWCLDPCDRLALENPPQLTLGSINTFDVAETASGTSGEVLFHFRVPVTATAQVYTYTLVVDARDHYPEVTPLYYQQSVRVLPPVRQVQKAKDPTFTVLPVTTSARPGQVPLEVQVTVHNISNRVDRFRLTCPDLAEDWYTVRYPEALETPGVVLETSSLALNPGAKGDIFLLLHPPRLTPAGIYSPTLRLQSVNNPDLALLDLVYLEVPPNYDLSLELRTLKGSIRQGPGEYEVALVNRGNTNRDLRLLAIGGEDSPLCDYQLWQEEVRLAPYQVEVVPLSVQPLKWWQRPWFGKSKAIHFFVEPADAAALPIAPPRLPGVLLWKPRPWWQALSGLLGLLLLLGLLGFLIWKFFPRSPAPPRILTFEAADTTYREATGEAIRLNWQIRNPRALQELRLTSSAEQNTTAMRPIVYDLRQGIPEALKPFCGAALRPVLICQGVPTAARKAGTYAFELAIVPRNSEGEPTDTRKTEAIAIQAPPAQSPVITEFKIDNQEARPRHLIAINPRQPIKQVVISWKVQGGNDVKVELLPAPGSVRPTGSLAYRVTPRIGAETYTLKARNAAGQEVSRSVVIETFDPTALVPSPSPSPLVMPPGGAGAPLPPIPVPGGALPSGALPGATPPGGQPSNSGQPGARPSPTPPAKPAAPANPAAPAPVDPNRLSPAELPPQFN